MEKEHLHLLINEEIYRLPEDELVAQEAPALSKEEKVAEVQESDEVAEPKPEPIAEEKAEPKTEVEQPSNVASEIEAKQKEEPEQESPEIPITDVEEPEELPIAVFHSSSDEKEIDLLHKIIAACKVPADQHKIFSNGFDQTVKFKKALVFIDKAKAFYTPIPYKGSEFLCSKPLSMLAADKNEKAKLWGALQKFLL
ncbi:hypothetical protein SAMN05421640_3712 [Ekhidna lutea]|uniref:Uncharacterized protein n=1 Tax=Ekhidna lutea TaxID=447679 RepID=A0A239MAG2_EKHLU|nr:hypothetical protein [Ekhidna lutea]SNT38839.1 hypothetical protein SAMN05421640_3712 [Ekhidna lutea]